MNHHASDGGLVQRPLQNVAINHERAQNHSVAFPLLETSYVNEDNPCSAREVAGPCGAPNVRFFR